MHTALQVNDADRAFRVDAVGLAVAIRLAFIGYQHVLAISRERDFIWQSAHFKCAGAGEVVGTSAQQHHLAILGLVGSFHGHGHEAVVDCHTVEPGAIGGHRQLAQNHRRAALGERRQVDDYQLIFLRVNREGALRFLVVSDDFSGRLAGRGGSDHTGNGLQADSEGCARTVVVAKRDDGCGQHAQPNEYGGGERCGFHGRNLIERKSMGVSTYFRF